MRMLEPENYRLAREFVRTRARPLDRALFEYEFDGRAPDAVWDELGRFANRDGGFGHGIEPDCRLPASSVLGALTAVPYLSRTKAPADHPLVQGGVRHLLDAYDRPSEAWRMLPPEVNDHPRASWWNYDPETAAGDLAEHWGNPSAELSKSTLWLAQRTCHERFQTPWQTTTHHCARRWHRHCRCLDRHTAGTGED